MAQYAAIQDGNFSTAATWNRVTNTPTIHATTGITITTSNFFTATFTAPNTTNACTGVLVYVSSIPASGGLVVTLQESTVDTAATVTVTLTGLPANSWYFAKFVTPYVFTTTGAGAYRFRFTRSGSSNTALAADSGGTLSAYLAMDNRTGPPSTGDDFWIVSEGTTPITVTVDGVSNSCGSGTDTTSGGTGNLVTPRTVGNGGTVCAGGKLEWDVSANSTLTLKGNLCIGPLGTWEMIPPSSSIFHTLTFDMVTTNNHGAYVTDRGIATLNYAAGTTGIRAKYVSGTGIAADPLITDANIGEVGDEVVVCAGSNNATNYNEDEKKFIKTKNSATSYVLSATAGGAESALGFTKIAGTWIFNIASNIVLNTTNTTTLRSFCNFHNQTIAGNVTLANIRFNSMSADSVKVITIGNYVVANGLACISFARRGFTFTGSVAGTYTRFVAGEQTNGSATSSGGISLGSAKNKIITNSLCYKTTNMGVDIGSSYSNTLNSVIVTGQTAVTATLAGWLFNVSGNNTLIDCEAHCCRNAGIMLNGGTSNIINNMLSGTKGNNGTHILATTDTFNTMTLNNFVSGTGTLIGNYLNMLLGSLIAFDTLAGTANNHVWYTALGSARSTGAGLADTTVRTAGSLGARLAPEDTTTGFEWSFDISSKANSIVTFTGYFQKNVAFGTDVCRVELWLPGSTVADDSQTLTDVTGTWQAVSLSAVYNGSVSRLATIKVFALTLTASAYIYADDFYNAGNAIATTVDPITGLDIWKDGQPSPVMIPLSLSAADVWGTDLSNFTTTATAGQLQNLSKLIPAAI